MKVLGLVLSLWLMASSAFAVDPTLPAATVDTAFPDTTGYTSVRVCASGCDYTSLQTAINTVTLGTIISLDAGTEYSASGQWGANADFGIKLKNKVSGSGWIIITTNGAVGSGWLPAQGTRLDGPTKRSNMAKIVRLTTTSGAMGSENGAHHYWFVGVEVQNAGNTESGFSSEGYYVNFDVSETGTVSADQPHHMVVDRSYIHGPGTAQSHLSRFGMILGGSHQAIVDSYVDDIMGTDGENKAIAGWNGTGPYKIVNNTLNASGENLLIGGANPFVVDDIPSDVTVQQNYFLKKLAWRDDTAYTTGASAILTKNTFEIKSGKRWLIEGNVFENAWVDGQSGWFFVSQPMVGLPADNPSTAYTTIQDITIRKNLIINVASGFWIRAGGVDSYNVEGPSVRGGRWLIEDNLFTNFCDTANQPGGPSTGQFCKVFDLIEGPFDVQFKNNTVVYASVSHAAPFAIDHYTSGSAARQQTLDRLIVQDNIVQSCESCSPQLILFTTSYTAGTDWLAPAAPSYTWTHNLAVGPWPGSGGDQTTYPILYPLAANPNWYAGTDITEAGYTNAAGGDYSLTALSTYHNAGSDGTDIGVDWAALQTAIEGAVTGIWSAVATGLLAISGGSGLHAISGGSGLLAIP